MPVDDFAPRLSYFFNSHNDFFEEIAKLRAARRIWARQLKERFGAKDPRSWMLRTHVQTAGCSLTAQQPMNNIVRVTIQALAAVLGGCQSLHTDSMDETLCLPSEQAVTVALRTQQIIAEESGVANTIDPLAGSYFVESLTNEMEKQAMAYITKIDDMGGIIKAIEAGYPQREIAEASYLYQKQVEAGTKTIVGLNKYQMRRRGAHPPAQDPPRGGGPAEGTPRRGQAHARREGRLLRAPRPHLQVQDRREPHARHPGLRPRLLHRRGDQQRHEGDLRRVPRDFRVLEERHSPQRHRDTEEDSER